MKRLFFIVVFIIIFAFSITLAADSGETDIPAFTIEQLMILSRSKQAKVDIIKKNNQEIEKYKEELTNELVDASYKINNLKVEVSENSSAIEDSKLVELKTLLEFLKDSTTTLNEDVQKVSSEIEILLDLILTKGMKLEQYDQIIENQNTLIVKMKTILSTVEKI